MTTPTTDEQLQSSRSRLHQLFDSNVFDRNHPDDGTCERAFGEVIRLLDDLLQESEASGGRIDFTKEVGVHGKIQDVTSLVSHLRAGVQTASDTSASVNTNRFNCYFGAGTGYFANGAFFTADYDNEVAFFVDDQRIYLNRHMKRATQEAEAYLSSASLPTTKL